MSGFPIQIESCGRWTGDGDTSQEATSCIVNYVTDIFGLDPNRTAWVERWAVSSGGTRRGHDELDLVRMDFDRSTGSFHSPKWERRDSFEDLLQELGGNRRS